MVSLPPVTESVLDRFHALATARRDATAFTIFGGETWTYGRWHDAATDVASALIAQGFPAGTRVAILAGTSALWPVADLGVLMAGMVSVGLYPTSAPAQVRDQLADCEARVVIVDDAAQLAKVRSIRAELPHLGTVIVAKTANDTDADADAVAFDDWTAGGRTARAESPAVAKELASASSAAHGASPAILIYTSGSTGTPKGAVISHETIAASAESARLALGMTAADRTISFLPFSHAAERMFGLYTRLWVGMEATLVPDIAQLWAASAAHHPTIFGGLPRFYEKACDAMRIADRAGGAAARDAERERLFGKALRIATSGGAALPPAVAEYLEASGVLVLGAYGQTEHLCVAFNRPERHRHDGVGWPMPGTEVRIADDGELLVKKSQLTFSGYFNKPDESRAAFTDDGAWLFTGDLAELRADGSLAITGRKKELLALSTGKKVAPLPIEAKLTGDGWISHAVLFGEGRPFVTALLCLGSATVRAWAQESHVAGDVASLSAHPEVMARVQSVVDRVNADLSRPEQVKRWVLLPHEFSVENGELTPTMKVRRADVTTRYARLIDPLYASATS
jgi:long-chain acyl-CoA synthetase